MKKKLFIVVLGMTLSAYVIPVCAQSAKDWDKMSVSEKNEFMQKRARELVLEKLWKYYPEANVANCATTMLSRIGQVSNTEFKARSLEKATCVTFTSDVHQTRSGDGYIGKVYFDPDTGSPVEVKFGNGKGYSIMVFGNARGNSLLNYNGYPRNVSFSSYKPVVEKGVEALQAFALDYYQPDARYNVSESRYWYDGKYNAVSAMNGKWYYTVLFFDNAGIGSSRLPYAARVNIGKDTNEVWLIELGDGKRALFINQSYEEMKEEKKAVQFVEPTND